MSRAQHARRRPVLNALWVAVVPLLGAITLVALPRHAQLPGGGPGELEDELRSDVFPEEILNLFSLSYPTVLGSDLLYQSYGIVTGDAEVGLLRRERMSSNDAWQEYTGTYSTSYAIAGFASRQGGDEVFLSGVEFDGTAKIERWRLVLPDGHQAVRYPLPTPAIGVPQPAYAPVVAPLGGTYIPTGGLPQPRRRTLHSSSTHVYTALAADPEGRFLLAYDYTDEALVRFPLASIPSAPEVLFEVATHPQLDQVSSIEIRDFATEGRKALLRRNYGHEPPSSEVFGVMHDEDNDGEWESLEFFSTTKFAASAYGNWSSWKLFTDFD